MKPRTSDELARLSRAEVLALHPGSMDDRSPAARRERRWLGALAEIHELVYGKGSWDLAETVGEIRRVFEKLDAP